MDSNNKYKRDFIQVEDALVSNNQIPAIEHNNIAGAKKVINNLGYLQFLATGAISPLLPQGAIVSVYNANAVTSYVGYSNNVAMPAPAAPGVDVIPLEPLSWTTICIGPNQYVLGAAGVSTYLLVDNTKLTPMP